MNVLLQEIRLSLSSLQEVVIQVNISELKEAVHKYLNGRLSIDEMEVFIARAGKAGVKIKSDISSWRREVVGYNPLVDKGSVSTLDVLVDRWFRFFKIRESFSERECQLLRILRDCSYPHHLIAYLFSRSLQEIRLELQRIDEPDYEIL